MIPYIKVSFPLDDELLEKQVELAKVHPRRRSMFVITGGPESPTQALLNTFMPDSYARPHKHPESDEVFEGVAGEFMLVIFDDEGKPIKYAKITEGRTIRIPAGRWHTAVCLSESGTVYESKDGYYNAEKDKIFAEWAPEEGSDGVPAYLEELKKSCLASQ